MTLTATPDEANGRVRIVLDGVNPGGYPLERTRADTGQTDVVRGGETGVIVWTHGVIDDYEAPFGTALTYCHNPNTPECDTVTFTPDDKVWLSHPFDPSLTLAVTLIDDDPWEWEVAGGVLDVIDSEWPVAVHSRRTVHRGSITLRTPWTDRVQMKALLIDGAPLLMRSYPDCRVDDQWAFIQTARREKSGGAYTDTLTWVLDYQRVARPEGSLIAPPANFWDAVAAAHPTWTDVTAAHLTWTDVVVTPHPHA